MKHYKNCSNFGKQRFVAIFAIFGTISQPFHCIEAAVLQSVLGLMKRLRFNAKVFSDNVVNSSGDHLPGSLYYCCLPEIIY